MVEKKIEMIEIRCRPSVKAAFMLFKLYLRVEKIFHREPTHEEALIELMKKHPLGLKALKEAGVIKEW